VPLTTIVDTARNKAQVHKIVEEMFNRGNLDVAPEIFAAEFVDRGHEQVADKKDGPEGFAQFVTAVRAALPELKATIQNMVAEGDYVASGTWQLPRAGVSFLACRLLVKR